MLLIFIAAAVVALILNPLVTFFQRPALPAALAIFAVYFGVLRASSAIVGVLARQPDRRPGQQRFQRRRAVDHRLGQRSASPTCRTDFDDKGINIQVKDQGQTALQTLQDKVVGGTERRSCPSAATCCTTIVTAGFGLILVFVLSIYMLIYGERIGALVRSVMPPGDGTPEDDYPTRVRAPSPATSAGSCCSAWRWAPAPALGL